MSICHEEFFERPGWILPPDFSTFDFSPGIFKIDLLSDLLQFPLYLDIVGFIPLFENLYQVVDSACRSQTSEGTLRLVVGFRTLVPVRLALRNGSALDPL